MTLLVLTALLIVLGSLSLFAASTIDFSTAAWEAVAGVGLDWTFVSDHQENSVLVRPRTPNPRTHRGCQERHIWTFRQRVPRFTQRP